MVMVLVTMLLLVVLGLAVVTLSYSSMQLSAGDNTNNKAYYAADAGARSAIEQVKYEVSHYYTDKLLGDTAGNYSSDYNNFFTNIISNCVSNFYQPVINGFSVNTTFTLGTFNSTDNTQPFLISCVSKATDGTQYKVNGTVTIKRIDVGTNSQWFIRDAAIIAGGTLNLATSNGMNASGSNVIVGAITRTNTWQLGVSGGTLVVDPSITNSIINPLTYPSYSNPTITNPNLYITTNNFTIDWSNVPSAPVSITTANNINVNVSTDIPSGTIYVKGNVKVSNGTINADVYCDGDMTVSNCNFKGKVYCRGNLSISSVNFSGSVRCDGNITMNNGSFTSTTYAGGSFTITSASSIGSIFAAGNISIANAGLSGGVIYSRTGVTMGNMSATAIVYSGGNVTLTGGGSITGCIIAKNNVSGSSDSNIWYDVKYDSSNIDNIVNKSSNSFFFSGSTPTLGNTDVIIKQNITPSGRVN